MDTKTIITRRNKLGWSRERLAYDSGLAVSTVWRMETAHLREKRPPKWHRTTLRAVDDALRVGEMAMRAESDIA